MACVRVCVGVGVGVRIIKPHSKTNENVIRTRKWNGEILRIDVSRAKLLEKRYACERRRCVDQSRTICRKALNGLHQMLTMIDGIKNSIRTFIVYVFVILYASCLRAG